MKLKINKDTSLEFDGLIDLESKLIELNKAKKPSDGYIIEYSYKNKVYEHAKVIHFYIVNYFGERFLKWTLYYVIASKKIKPNFRCKKFKDKGNLFGSDKKCILYSDNFLKYTYCEPFLVNLFELPNVANLIIRNAGKRNE